MNTIQNTRKQDILEYLTEWCDGSTKVLVDPKIASLATWVGEQAAAWGGRPETEVNRTSYISAYRELVRAGVVVEYVSANGLWKVAAIA